MYIVKGGFSTLKQIKGSPRTRCLTLDKTGGKKTQVATRCEGETRHISVIGPGSKQLTGTAVDKTGLNVVPKAFMAGFQGHAIKKKIKIEIKTVQ